jgi:hypothetical protein
VIGAVLAAAAAAAAPGGAEDAARVFGAALEAGHAAELRPILPRQGKVQLALSRLGSEQGAYGASQVEALFREALARVQVSRFRVDRTETDGRSFALVHASARLVDRHGRPGPLALHLSFQPEGGGWVVREIRERSE